MKQLFAKVFGDENSRALSAMEPRVKEINALEETLKTLSDEELQAKTPEFKKRLEAGETLDDILPEAFALVREAARRRLGMRHFDVQLIGGMTIHEGNIAEMRTGEGKTLVATLPAYLNALTGKGVHIVTVNDYLARRDAVWMSDVYSFLGLSVGVIGSSNQSYLYDASYAKEDSPADEERDEEGYYKVVHEYLRPCSRPEAYAADITYGTNNEFGFDYLRDNLAYSKEMLRQRSHTFTIVDEIDSVLIDEARTPLIISAAAEESGDLYQTFRDIATTLKKEEDFTVDEKQKAIELTESGIEKAEKVLGVENIYTDKGIKYVHHLETAVRAKALFTRDKDYVVKDGQVIIVDQFTGRLMPGRRFNMGLHQALEAKEGVEVQKESRTYASITFQNYFRMYEKLSGMTGTAKSSQEEFEKVYNLRVVVIPTNVPTQRVDHNDLIYQTEKGKFKAIAGRIKELNDVGQPVLVGTVSIEKNELLSEYLHASGIKHSMLNAKNHEKEASIVAEAGRKGAVTIATNMAGRGVDIKLGGDGASKEEAEEIKKLGGLFVLGTERHDARRIDNQLRGRSGRQGDPGETQFFVSLEDDLMRIFATDAVKGMMGRFGIPEDQPIQNKMITRSLESAQERIEGVHFDSRRAVLSYDDVLNTQRLSIYERRRALLEGGAGDVGKELDRIIEHREGLEAVVEEKKELLGEEEFVAVARRMFLQTIDMLWVEHLEGMEYLRSSVSLRAYGQRDPLVEYKKEGKAMYEDMLHRLDETVAKLIGGIGEGAFKQEQQRLQAIHKQAERLSEKGSSAEDSGGTQITTRRPTDKSGEKIGRNDMVKIRKGGEEKIMKYKKAQPLIEQGEWELVGKAQ